jgi:uncharacterized membrane protein
MKQKQLTLHLMRLKFIILIINYLFIFFVLFNSLIKQNKIIICVIFKIEIKKQNKKNNERIQNS